MKKPAKQPQGAGRSSFSLVEPEKVFRELQLKSGMTFLDMACGAGQYALMALKYVGAGGFVCAIDLWQEGIDTLEKQIVTGGIQNLQALIGDISKRMPIETDSVDMCFMATALHELTLTDTADMALEEAARLLKPDGSLAIIEFKKIPGPPGPPLHLRLDPGDVAEIVTPHGFAGKSVTEVGPYTFLMTFDRHEAS
ncbi:MAG: methyltransferase domain-containing protein [Deltaproteobacteria bacterium]|nr:methyltransferase domain-containing protein [Deltaproteobacteria bacterium]